METECLPPCIDSGIIEKLLRIEAESGWTSTDVDDPSAGIRILQRFLDELLNYLVHLIPNIAHAYIAFTGVEPAVFKPLSAFGRTLTDIESTHTLRDNTLLAKFLKLFPNDPVILIEEPNTHPEFKGDQRVMQKAIIKLIGYGEFFGFISLDTHKTNLFDDATVSFLKRLQPILSRISADANFTMRLRQLTNSFEAAARNGDLLQLYQEITDRTVLAFGAAGAILRTYDPLKDALAADAYSGDVDDRLIAPGSVGEQICREVIDDPEHHWTVGVLDSSDDLASAGTRISQEMQNKLREIGILSYFVTKLTSDVSNRRDVIGTIAFYHFTAQKFSWRDIGLAQSLCQRASDIISLYKNTKRLQEANENLIAANELLFTENKLTTKYEIVSLLSHDLGHKALHTTQAFSDFITQVKKAMREGRQFPSIQKHADSVDDAIKTFQTTLYNINQLFRPTEGQQESEFRISDVIKEVVHVMDDALKRNNCEPDAVYKADPLIYGNMTILAQVFFNLLVNSVEAQRSRRERRKNIIHIRVQKELTKQEKIEILFWDEGPGINRKLFPSPTDIFLLGKTSKREGTGSGLPISRNLLSVFFSGHLDLNDPDKALFRILLPIRSKSDTH